MLESSQAVTKGLIGSGIGQNDVISIIAENICEFPAITFGAFYLNTIVAPINVTYSIRKFIAHDLEDFGGSLYICVCFFFPFYFIQI